MRFFLAILLGLLATSATAQTASRHGVFGRYQQVIWQERDGLPQNTVAAIATTRDGYLWLGTYEGAVRFDGVRFTRFNPSNTTGIGNAFVTALLERQNGELWLATYGGGVSRYTNGRFMQFSTRDGLSSDLALCLFEDRGGTLWVGSDGGGVSAFGDGRFTTYTLAQGLPGSLVRAIVDDGEGGLLAGTNHGIARIAGGRVIPYAGNAELAHADISMLARASDGVLWAATMSGALYRVDAAGAAVLDGQDGWSNDRVGALLPDAAGSMWVGTLNHGLRRFEAGRFQSVGLEDGLPGANALAIARATDGGLWVGTDGGLVRLRTPRVTTYSEGDGLASDFVGSIIQDAEGNAWVENGRGLTRFADGVFTTVIPGANLPVNRVLLADSASGRATIFTSNGLARWTGARFTPVETPAGIPWDRVRAVVEDSNGTLWLAVREGGLLRVRDGQVSHLGASDGLADDSVLSLYEDRAGSLWVGTLRNGISRISHGQVRSWSARDGLAANHVKAFHEDTTGTIWIGTHGGGLSRFKDGRFATISVRQGLYNDDIFQILEDDEGNLWMNCNTGIWRTSLRELNDVADGRRATVESFDYGTGDGMLTSEGVGATLAGSKMRDGSLWFPTIRGIVSIDPRQHNTEPPRVSIESAAVDRQGVMIDGPLRMTPGQENLEIQYTGLSWSRAQAMRFRYRMNGLDHEWIEAGARRTAYYSHLPPGSYAFTVIADNGEGVWSPAGATLAIVVLPRVYQTWWFRTGLALGLIAMVGLSWRYRARQLRRAQDAQQAFSRQLIASQETERQRIAAELHDGLGQNLLVVKNRAVIGALSQPVDGEARRQFDEIGATVAQSLDEVRAISYNLRPHHLDQLGLTTTIRAMIDRVSESTGIAVTGELDDIDGVFPPADEITIYRIVQESLNNVVKHSGARDARVTVRCYEEHVDITVQDSGHGFVPSSSRADPLTSGGFGLKGIAERVQMLGGTYSIDSSPGRGTTIAVRLAIRPRGPLHGA